MSQFSDSSLDTTELLFSQETTNKGQPNDVMSQMLDAIRSLQNEVKILKATKSNSELEPRTNESGEHSNRNQFTTPTFVPQSPLIGIPETFDLNARYNLAAMTILMHSNMALQWQQSDLEDSPDVLARITGNETYLLAANRKEALLNCDGSRSNSHMLLFRKVYKTKKYFVLKADCSPAQGKQLHRLINRMFTRREHTNANEILNLDPVRKEFTKFIGDVCFGKFVNPKIPRQTGVTLHDLHQRIEIIADRIRALFFGEPSELEFCCTKDDGSQRLIVLPTRELLQKEIKLKFTDKEGSELRYIRNHLKEFDKYNMRFDEEDVDQTHERSRPVIAAWRNSRKLKGHVVEPISTEHKRKGGKGKAKLFSFECVSTPNHSKAHLNSGVSSYSSSSSSGGTSSSGGMGSSSSSSSSSYNQTASGSSSGSSRGGQSYSGRLGSAIAVMEATVENDLIDEDDMAEYSLPVTKRARVLSVKKITSSADKHLTMYACSDEEASDAHQEEDSDRDEDQDVMGRLNFRSLLSDDN